MIHIEIAHPDDFLKIAETLTRMGIASNKEKKLYQSCHILQKQGQYFIVHFKEMLKLDGLPVDITEEDFDRRNGIVSLLHSWGLCTIKTPISPPESNNFRVISHKQKSDWTLIAKYKFG
ncbi:translation repressor [Aeromonas phage GomatiRiver_11]|nr:translation repressor protein [Aeromonas phage AhFM11]WKW84273.1 translation repressor [Aeromonas phage GomatiRiver_11]